MLPDIDFEEEHDEPDAGDDVDEASGQVVRMVDQILINAYRKNTSDIHIEPSVVTKKTSIRYRIDGVCQEVLSVPISHSRAIMSRLKIMSNLDIAERRLPQDGKIKVPPQGGQAFRTTPGHPAHRRRVRGRGTAHPGRVRRHVPGRHGHDRAQPDRTKTDHLPTLRPGSGGRAHTARARPPPCTPPWGTSTNRGSKYGRPRTRWRSPRRACARWRPNRRSVSTSPRIMRAFLRADPDVIMIGEMRDHETAGIGLEASLTGHLVLFHPAHQQRAGNHHPPAGHGAQPAEFFRRLPRRAGPAAHPPPLQGMPPALSPQRRRVRRNRHGFRPRSLRRDGHHPRCGADPQPPRRLRGVLRHRLPGAEPEPTN